mmetsp:Transcript_101523/g.269993  ORF Transcript_101523/g.269993 Transcript_101523/m.269993 type:complete len:300 (+) Transcript_101523:162-1061(+)
MPAVRLRKGPAALQRLWRQAGEPVRSWKRQVLWLLEALQQPLHLRLLREHPGSQGIVLHGLPTSNAAQLAALVDREVAAAAAAATGRPGGKPPCQICGRLAAPAAALEVELLLERRAALRGGPHQVVAREVADLHRLAGGDGPDGHQLRLARGLAGDDLGVWQAAVVRPADGGEYQVVAAAVLPGEREGVDAEDARQADHLLQHLLGHLRRLRPRLPELGPDARCDVLTAVVQARRQDVVNACAPAAPDAALGHRPLLSALDHGFVQLGVPPPALEAGGQRDEAEVALPHEHVPGRRWL